MVLTGAEREPLTEDGHTAMGTDSPSLRAPPLLNASYLHSPPLRHSGVTAPDLQMGPEPQGLPRLSPLPGPAADRQDIPSATDVFGMGHSPGIWADTRGENSPSKGLWP